MIELTWIQVVGASMLLLSFGVTVALINWSASKVMEAESTKE